MVSRRGLLRVPFRFASNLRASLQAAGKVRVRARFRL